MPPVAVVVPHVVLLHIAVVMLSAAFVHIVMPPITIVVPPLAVLHLAVVVPPVAVVFPRRVVVPPIAFSVAFAARRWGAMVCVDMFVMGGDWWDAVLILRIPT
jgi:hypothetical protein